MHIFDQKMKKKAKYSDETSENDYTCPHGHYDPTNTLLYASNKKSNRKGRRLTTFYKSQLIPIRALQKRTYTRRLDPKLSTRLQNCLVYLQRLQT
jgi:hypothetical protein